MSGPQPGLAGRLGSPGLPAPSLRLTGGPRERSARAETGKFALGHPRSPNPLATGMGEFFFQKRRNVKVSGGDGRVWPPLCGLERRRVLPRSRCAPTPGKGSLRSWLSGGGRGTAAWSGSCRAAKAAGTPGATEARGGVPTKDLLSHPRKWPVTKSLARGKGHSFPRAGFLARSYCMKFTENK